MILGNLQETFLINTKNLTPKQIKSAYFWSEAIYKTERNKEKTARIAIESDNTNFIKGLKKDKSLDPKKTVDCSRWENNKPI